VLQGNALFARLRLVLAQGFDQQSSHTAARFAFEQDEAPGRQLAVVGRAHARRENPAQFIGVRPRRRHRLGGAGPAREQEAQRAGRGVIQCGLVGHRGVPCVNFRRRTW